MSRVENSGSQRCDECGWVGDRKDCTEWEGTVACPYCANVIKQNADSGDSIRTDGGEDSGKYQDAIDVLEREIRARSYPQDDCLRLARRVLLAEWGKPDAPPVPSGDTKHCELCGCEVEGNLKLTDDGHPHGVNRLVGDCCIGLEERLPEFEADFFETGDRDE